jgi:hypothetical protein
MMGLRNRMIRKNAYNYYYIVSLMFAPSVWRKH